MHFSITSFCCDPIVLYIIIFVFVVAIAVVVLLDTKFLWLSYVLRIRIRQAYAHMLSTLCVISFIIKLHWNTHTHTHAHLVVTTKRERRKICYSFILLLLLLLMLLRHGSKCADQIEKNIVWVWAKKQEYKRIVRAEVWCFRHNCSSDSFILSHMRLFENSITLEVCVVFIGIFKSLWKHIVDFVYHFTAW